MIHGVDDRIPRVAYTVDEAALALAVSPRTVSRLIARGELRALRIGKAVRISVRELGTYARRETKRAS